MERSFAKPHGTCAVFLQLNKKTSPRFGFFQIEKTKSIRVTTSLAGYADHSVRSELLLNLYPVNGGFPSFTTAKTGFAKAASGDELIRHHCLAPYGSSLEMLEE